MSDYDRFAERLELRYTGIDNWLFYAEGEWEEEYGQINENQNIDEDVPLDKSTNALGQKYTIGANWYPTIWPGSTFTELPLTMKISEAPPFQD